MDKDVLYVVGGVALLWVISRSNTGVSALQSQLTANNLQANTTAANANAIANAAQAAANALSSVSDNL